MRDCELEEDCEYQNADGNCSKDICKHYIDQETLGDMKYHRWLDDRMEER